MESVLEPIRRRLGRVRRHGIVAEQPVGGVKSDLVAAELGPQPSDLPEVRLEPVRAAAILRDAALLNIRDGRFGPAQRELEQAMRLDPACGAEDDLRALRAIRRCRRRIATQPSNPVLHIELGRTYLELDLAAEAMDELREAARLAPRMAEPHIIMAIEHLYSSRPAEAEEEYDHAMTAEQGLPPFSQLVEALRAARSAGGSLTYGVAPPESVSGASES